MKPPQAIPIRFNKRIKLPHTSASLLCSFFRIVSSASVRASLFTEALTPSSSRSVSPPVSTGSDLLRCIWQKCGIVPEKETRRVNQIDRAFHRKPFSCMFYLTALTTFTKYRICEDGATECSHLQINTNVCTEEHLCIFSCLCTHTLSLKKDIINTDRWRTDSCLTFGATFLFCIPLE